MDMLGGRSFAALVAAMGGDLRCFAANFSNPVFPGDVLVVRGWNEGQRVVLRVSTEERPETVCLSNAYAVLS